MIYKIFNFILQKLSTETELRILFQLGFIDKEMAPIKCHYCGSEQFVEVVVDTLDYYTTEKKSVCQDCGKTIGYWSYGYWMA